MEKVLILTGSSALLFGLFIFMVLTGFIDFHNVGFFIESFAEWVELLFPAAISATLLIFSWGLFKLISAKGGEESKAKAKKIIFWALVNLFLISVYWYFATIIFEFLSIFI